MRYRQVCLLAILGIAFLLSNKSALATSFQISWNDNSSDETGFRLERKLGTSGTYGVIATTAANVTSYRDANLADNTMYCYRVNAFNSAGSSPYAPQVCATTPAGVSTPPSTQQFTLAVNIVKTMNSSGTGNGTVTSNPAGINCSSSCSASYNGGTVVTLSAIPAVGSSFAGWSGTGCTNGVITLNANTTCTATFTPQSAQSVTLSIAKTGSGSGTVTSSPGGIDCGNTCSASYNSGTAITLSASPAADSTFLGWSGSGCTSGAVTLNANMTCVAIFESSANQLQSRIGVFRPSTGQWFLDYNGNGQWDDAADRYIASNIEADDLPVVGGWSGNGRSNIGTFTAATGTWRFDTNGDGVLDCSVDSCVTSFGQPGDFPVTRNIGHGQGISIGLFRAQSVAKDAKGRKMVIRGRWQFDSDSDSTLDGCDVDDCVTFGNVGELPVVGDWDGAGTEVIGVFLPKKGSWYLDVNGNGQWDGCRIDRCFGRFGTKGDLPVVGDWDGTGFVRVGVFRPSTGMWYLDLNGNGKLDKCSVDACFGPFGEAGDLPVVGKW